MRLSAVRFTQYYFDIVVRRSKRLVTLTSVIRGRSAIYIRTSHRPHIRGSFRQGAGHEVLNGRLAPIDPLLSRYEARFYIFIVSPERIRHSEGHEYVLRAFAVVNK